MQTPTLNSCAKIEYLRLATILLLDFPLEVSKAVDKMLQNSTGGSVVMWHDPCEVDGKSAGSMASSGNGSSSIITPLEKSTFFTPG